MAIKCRLCLGELDQNALNMFEVEEGKENSSISVQLLEIFQLEVGFVSQTRLTEIIYTFQLYYNSFVSPAATKLTRMAFLHLPAVRGYSGIGEAIQGQDYGIPLLPLQPDRGA